MDLLIPKKSRKRNHTALCFVPFVLAYSLSIMFPRFIQVVACIGTSFFLWLNNVSFYVYIPRLLFHSPIDGHFTYFHLLAVMNTSCYKVCIEVSVWTYVFISVGYLHRIGITGPPRDSVFNFLRNHHSVFHSAGTDLYSHPQYKSPCLHNLASILLIY